MALLPNMYRPIVSPEMFGGLLPRPENMGGPARVTMPTGVLPSAPPIMAQPAAGLGLTPPQPGAMASLPANVGNILAPANNPTRLNLAGGAEGFTNAGLTAADEDMAYIQQDPSGMAAERRVPIGPDETFRFTDRRTGETITSTGPEEYEAVNRAFQRAGSSAKANAVIERQNPETGTFEQYAELTPPVSQAAILAGLAAAATGAGALATLPAAGAAAGAGGVGGATAGGALGANTMAQAGLQAAGLQSLATPGITVLGNAAGAGIGSAGAALGSAAGSTLGAAATGGARPPAQPAPEPEIVVPGDRPALPAGFDPGSIAPVLPNLIQSVATPTPDVSPEIVVERDRAPTSFEEPPAVLPPVVPDFTNLPQPDVSVPEQNSLLDEIIKYYSLGSGVLDLLGGAFGGGGGGQIAPYTSSLGPMPTFTRGGFTPFTGDYETYGFGPEFNFFGGQPAPTPTAPAFGLLPPAAMPGSLVV